MVGSAAIRQSAIHGTWCRSSDTVRLRRRQAIFPPSRAHTPVLTTTERRSRFREGLAQPYPIEELLSPTRFEDQVELKELINLALRNVLPKYRICLLLQKVNGFSPAEIADFLEISEKTVGAYIAKAREQFRQAYERLINE